MIVYSMRQLDKEIRGNFKAKSAAVGLRVVAVLSAVALDPNVKASFRLNGLGATFVDACVVGIRGWSCVHGDSQ